jgi:hypothetical protein
VSLTFSAAVVDDVACCDREGELGGDAVVASESTSSLLSLPAVAAAGGGGLDFLVERGLFPLSGLPAGEFLLEASRADVLTTGGFLGGFAATGGRADSDATGLAAPSSLVTIIPATETREIVQTSHKCVTHTWKRKRTTLDTRKV